MGEVPRRVEPVGEGKAEVVPVQFDEGRAKLGGKVELLGEGVRLELKAPTQRRQHKGQDLKQTSLDIFSASLDE